MGGGRRWGACSGCESIPWSCEGSPRQETERYFGVGSFHSYRGVVWRITGKLWDREPKDILGWGFHSYGGQGCQDYLLGIAIPTPFLSFVVFTWIVCYQVVFISIWFALRILALQMPLCGVYLADSGSISSPGSRPFPKRIVWLQSTGSYPPVRHY